MKEVSDISYINVTTETQTSQNLITKIKEMYNWQDILLLNNLDYIRSYVEYVWNECKHLRMNTSNYYEFPSELKKNYD